MIEMRTLATTEPGLALSCMAASGTPYCSARAVRSAGWSKVAMSASNAKVTLISPTLELTIASCTCTSVSVVRPTVTASGSPPRVSVSNSRPGQWKPELGHASGSAEPVGAQKPGSTPTQPDDALRPVRLLVVPASHGDGLDAPAPQNEPLVHATQAVRTGHHSCVQEWSAQIGPEIFENV